MVRYEKIEVTKEWVFKLKNGMLLEIDLKRNKIDVRLEEVSLKAQVIVNYMSY